MNIATTHGTVAVAERGAGGATLVFIHGNSSSKEIFARQLQSPLADRHRLLAVDLPGHGDSADATDPQRTYTIPGYADAVREVLASLGVERPILVGWSLGGHIAIELLSGDVRPRGVVITGSPPFARSMESVAEAFAPTPLMQMTGKPDFTDDEALTFARATSTPELSQDDLRYVAARRTDGRARQRMLAAVLEGLGVDQRRTVEETDVPLAIINGEHDPFLNHSYFSQPRYARLWRGEVQRLAGLGHAPFFEQPERYNDLLSAFCDDVLRGG